MVSVSIVMPCRNETQGLVASSVKKLRAELEGMKLDIMVVENGSHMLRRIPGTRYFNTSAGGLGIALKLGIRKAKHENVVFLPADMSYDLSFVGTALIEDADIVIGSKSVRGSVVERPIKRKIVSKVYGWKTRIGNGIHVKDITGVKLYKKSKVVPLLAFCKSEGIRFEVELQKEAEKHGLRVKEIPVIVHDYRETKILEWGSSATLIDGYKAAKGFGIRKLNEKEFQRYLAVGLVGIALFEGAFFVLNQFIPYWLSYLISFEVVTDINFLMHDTYTFKGQKHYSRGKRFIIFQSQAIVYRIVQYSLFFGLSLFINIYLALLIAILIAFIYSYTFNKKITWKERQEQ